MLKRLEEERQKLNKMGGKAISRSLSLSQDQTLQQQSRKVDELMVQYHISKQNTKEEKGGRA